MRYPKLRQSLDTLESTIRSIRECADNPQAYFLFSDSLAEDLERAAKYATETMRALAMAQEIGNAR